MKRPRGLKQRLWVTATAHVRVACNWCGLPFAYGDMVADHFPALAEGGTPYGAVLACKPCDARRSKETNARVNAKRRQGRRHKSRRKRKGRGK